MIRLSAGLLVYRRKSSESEVLLVHPGGPFWSNKDLGAWSIPKGEYEKDESPLEAAKREFEEEIGQPPPEGVMIELGEIRRKDRKIITVWAVEGDLDVSSIVSNTIEIEWPPRTGRILEIPEVDKAEWFSLSEAGPKLHKGQDEFITRLANLLKES